MSIRANTKGSAGVYGQFNNDIIEPQATFTVDVNNKTTDYEVGFILDHDFKLAGNALHLIPTAGVIAGTQNYYDEYFTKRINKKDKKGNVKSVITNPNKLAPLVYELSAKGTYMVGKWLLSLIPTYAIPLSPAEITINKKTFHEKLSNSFYVELDICHR